MAQVIQLRDYGRRVRAGVHAQQVPDQIAKALKASAVCALTSPTSSPSADGGTISQSQPRGVLVSRHGATGPGQSRCGGAPIPRADAAPAVQQTA